jgi:dienelactone hydrolase
MTKFSKLVVALALTFISLGIVSQQQVAKPTPTTQADAMADYPDVQLISADPEQGFQWPYLLFVPANLADASHPTKARLMVVPNNTGHTSDDPLVHLISALHEEYWRTMATGLNAVLLIPVFPRPASDDLLYTHALGRAAMLTTVPGMVRLDLQLIRMIENARSREKTAGIELDARAMMLGFSASGMFVNRFVFMHPEFVQAAAIGSPGGWPIAPVPVYQGQKLRYPIGVADFQQVTGKPFDLAAVAKVPQMIFMGDQDSNDSVIYNDSYEDRDRITVFKLFGPTLVARWPTAVELYHQNLPLVEFKLYPGASHAFTKDMKTDVAAFFAKNAS